MSTGGHSKCRSRAAKERAHQLWETFLACPTLEQPSLQRDALWVAVQRVVCTRAVLEISPLGSQARVRVSRDHASEELLAAMSWLHEHDADARGLDAAELFTTLRGVATRGHAGSARAAQSDLLHGMTGVPAGRAVRWTSLDAPDQQ